MDSTLYQQVYYPTTADSATKSQQLAPSLFTISKVDSNSLKPHHRDNSRPTDFLFSVLLVCLLIFTISNLLFRKFLKNHALSFFIDKYKAVNIDTEQKIGIIPALLSFNFYLVLAVFIMQTLNFFGLNDSNYSQWELLGILVLFIFGFSIFKILFYILSSLLFSSYPVAKSILGINNQFEYILTILFIPINFLFIFSFQVYIMLFIALILFSIALIYKLIKTFLVLKNETLYQGFQIILYLCTLEILPLLVIILWPFLY